MRTVVTLIIALSLVLVSNRICNAQDGFPLAGKTIGEKVNVRAQPNLKTGAILGSLPLDKSLKIVGQTKDGAWYEIAYPAEIPQYVYAKYVRITNGKSGIICGRQVRVRTAPSTKSTIVTELKRNTPVTVLGTRGRDWVKISPLPNSRCFISAEFVKIAGPYRESRPAAKPASTPAVKSVNAGRKPAESHAVVKTQAAPNKPVSAKSDAAATDMKAEIAAREKARKDAIEQAKKTADQARAILDKSMRTQASAKNGSDAPKVTNDVRIEAVPVAVGVIEPEKNNKYAPFTYHLRRSGITMYYLKSDKIDLGKFANKRCAIYGNVGNDLSKITRRATISVTDAMEIKENNR